MVTQKELAKNILKATERILIQKTLGLSEASFYQTKKLQSDNQQPIKTENQTEKEANSLIQQAKQKKAIRKTMNLLFDAFSETNPIEILVYGMFVKKHLSTIVPSGNNKKIEKTLEWLEEGIRLVEEYMLDHPEILVSMTDNCLESLRKIGS